MIPLSHCRIAQPVPLWLVPLKSGPGRGLSSMDCLGWAMPQPGLGNAPANGRERLRPCGISVVLSRKLQ